MCLSGEGPLKGKEVLLSVIAGSISYGLNTKDSDVDIRGVFAHPIKDILVGEYEKVIQENNNDTIYTEIGFFLKQLRKNTPSALEVLFTTDPEHVKIRDKRFNPLIEKVLSKKCFYTFGAYAESQILKAKNVNKKSANPFPKERKTLKDFSWVLCYQHSIPYRDWLECCGIKETNLSLCKMNHAENVYVLYNHPCKAGPILDMNINITSVPKNANTAAYVIINIPAYQKYCKEYKEYWDWVAKRNEKRYATNVEKTSNKTFYDTKNMMHLFRLMSLCREILKDGTLTVKCNPILRQFLLKIRNGDFEYDYLMELANEKSLELKELFNKSKLSEKPDKEFFKNYILNFYE